MKFVINIIVLYINTYVNIVIFIGCDNCKKEFTITYENNPDCIRFKCFEKIEN
mgnify:CR=1 FL=1